MLQQVTTNLPEEDRTEIIELITTMQSIKPRKSTKRWSSTLPQTYRVAKTERYTLKDEGANINEPETSATNKSVTLIGSCRAARIREDNSVFLFQESHRIKSLLNKCESFNK